MCGRITATFEFSDLWVRWNLDRDLAKYTPRFNIAPEQTSPTILVIVHHKGGNECRLMHWGLIPHWAANPSIGNRMINARAETLTELPSFKLLVDRRRCIIPADGFYEWRKEGKRKVPMWVHLKSREPFALAGLWDVWRKPDGKRMESFTIITTEPNELIEPVHNWMPVILQSEDEEQWLDASRTPFVKAKSLLKPYPDELMDAHDVSPVVNSAKLRWAGVHPTHFRRRYASRQPVVPVVSNIKSFYYLIRSVVRPICFALEIDNQLEFRSLLQPRVLPHPIDKEGNALTLPALV